MAMWRSSLMQTASNGAAAVMAAAVKAGNIGVADDEFLELFDGVRDHIFERLDEVAGEDDARQDESLDRGEKKSSSKSKSSKSKSSSSKKSKKSSGSKSRNSGSGKGRGGSSITLEDAEETELNFGAFEGVTLGDLADISEDEAEGEYKYRNGSGADYLAWLASDGQSNDYIRRRAILVCEDRDIEPLEED